MGSRLDPDEISERVGVQGLLFRVSGFEFRNANPKPLPETLNFRPFLDKETWDAERMACPTCTGSTSYPQRTWFGNWGVGIRLDPDKVSIGVEVQGLFFRVSGFEFRNANPKALPETLSIKPLKSSPENPAP